MKTIGQLRKEGYKVRVMHERCKMDPRGGKTTIEVTVPDLSVSVTGVAECSKKDNFNRKLGNNIALGRAFEQLANIQNGAR